VQVTLVDGKVSVSRVSAASSGRRADAMVLAPGQRLIATGEAAPVLDTPRIEAVTAWRRGEVLLNDTPLAEAVAEMNRYDTTHIVIDDPDIAGLIVSGLYHTGDSEGFATSVARMYRLRILEKDGRIQLRKN
jgi:transmembrane sensor